MQAAQQDALSVGWSIEIVESESESEVPGIKELELGSKIFEIEELGSEVPKIEESESEVP